MSVLLRLFSRVNVWRAERYLRRAERAAFSIGSMHGATSPEQRRASSQLDRALIAFERARDEEESMLKLRRKPKVPDTFTGDASRLPEGDYFVHCPHCGERWPQRGRAVVSLRASETEPAWPEPVDDVPF